jgi:hypothetical protein
MSSNIITPNDHISHDVPYGLNSIVSGAIYMGLPHIVENISSVLLNDLANPKSPILTILLETRILWGFKSL